MLLKVLQLALIIGARTPVDGHVPFDQTQSFCTTEPLKLVYFQYHNQLKYRAVQTLHLAQTYEEKIAHARWECMRADND